MMRARGRIHVATPRAATCALLALALACAAPARAQEDRRPELAGHVFVSTDLVPDAFVRSFVRTSLGYAEALSVDYPPTVVGRDTLATLNGSLNYATLGIEYQALLQDWIAARLEAGLVTRLGTQTTSLVNEGVTVSQGYDFGFLIRLHQTPKTALCGSIGVTNQQVTIVDVKQFAQDVVDGVPNARLIDYLPTVRSNAGLRYAWAANRSVGVSVLGEGSYGDAPRRHSLTSWGWDLGASVDYAFAPKHGIPLGTALAYRVSSLPGVTNSNNGSSSQTALRIAYTGQRDLVAVDLLGLFDRHNTVAESISAGGVALSMRIYF